MRRGAVWGASAAAVAAMVVLAVLVANSRTGPQMPSLPSTLPEVSAQTPSPSGTSGPLFPTQSVEELVIPTAEIPAVAGLPATPDTGGGPMYAETTAVDPNFISPSPCARMPVAGLGSLFRGSGWISSRYQQSWGKASAKDTKFAWRVTQFIAVYPGADQARNLVSAARGFFGMCANQSIDATHDPPRADEPNPIYWSVNALQGSLREPTTTISLTQEGGGGWKMWRAVAAHNNVAMDLVFAAQDAPESAVQAMVQAIKNRVDAAR